MKILTLNTWQDRGPWRDRWRIILEGLGQMKPDIAAFQELFDPDWAEEVRRKSGYPHLYFPKYHSGLAILSRLPASASGEKSLTPSPLEEYGRYLHWLEIEQGKRRFYFFNTHVSWKLEDGSSRRRQYGEILGFIREIAGEGESLLVGDLNAPPDSEEIRWLIREGGFRDIFEEMHPGEAGFSWDNRNPYAAGSSHVLPDRRIDQVLVRNAGGFFKKPAACDLVYTKPDERGIWATDHFGVLASFQ